MVNSFTVAYIKALNSKIDVLKSRKFKSPLYLDELEYNQEIDRKIQKIIKELHNISLKINVVIGIVVLAIHLILVYISLDNPKIITLLC